MIHVETKDFKLAKKISTVFDNCLGICLFDNSRTEYCNKCVFYEFAEEMQTSSFYLVIIKCLGMWKNFSYKKPHKKIFLNHLLYLAAILYSANEKRFPVISEDKIDIVLGNLIKSPNKFLKKFKKKIYPWRFYWLSGFRGECKKDGIVSGYWNLMVFVIYIFITSYNLEKNKTKTSMKPTKRKIEVDFDSALEDIIKEKMEVPGDPKELFKKFDKPL